MAFPETPVLDAFTGTGALSASWKTPLFPAYTAWERDTNVAKANAANSFSASYWQETQFGPNCEVFATIAAMPVAGDCRIHCRLQNPGFSEYSSYHVTFHATNTFLDRTIAGTRTTIKNFFTVVSVNDVIGVKAIGNTLWVMRNGEPLGAPTIDTGIAGGGYLGIWSQNDASVRLDNFGGGTLFAPAPHAGQYGRGAA